MCDACEPDRIGMDSTETRRNFRRSRYPVSNARVTDSQRKMSPEQLITTVTAAFKDVPQPLKNLITSCACEECTEIRNDFSGKQPEDLESDRMRYHSYDMGFFTADARQYYLPGWMRLAINNQSLSCTDALTQVLLYHDGWDSQMGYDVRQQQAVADFLNFLSEYDPSTVDGQFRAAQKKWNSFPLVHAPPKLSPTRLP